PGTILISIVAPIVFTSGKPELIASAATAVVAWRTGNLAISMVVGVLSVFFLRQIW
ncbi:MAG: AzlD domain-containing protein, partial [Deltaproteobacteria bacterium]|nr:AzlD domain-containing protein [Deltaproteobacteria bacterium]